MPIISRGGSVRSWVSIPQLRSAALGLLQLLAHVLAPVWPQHNDHRIESWSAQNILC